MATVVPIYSRLITRLVTVAAVALLGAGCNMPTKGGGPPPPPCEAGSLLPPELLSPDWIHHAGTLASTWILDTTTPTLSWQYPDETCAPDHYVIEVATSSDFAPENIVESGGNIGWSYRWPAGRELEVGHRYYWHVAAVSMGGAQGPWSYTAILLIGPACPLDEPQVPRLLSPADGALVTTLNPLLRWEYPDAGCLVHWTALQISTSAAFPASQTATSATTHYGNEDRPAEWLGADWLTASFELENCKRYFWRVRTDPDGDLTSAWSFDVNTTGLICPLDLGPVITPIGPEIPLPAGIPGLAPLAEVNCRMGPGTAYEVVTRLAVGGQYPINGRNGDSTWWYVNVPASGQFCWVWGDLVETNGDTSNVPQQEATQLGCWVQDNPQFPKRCVVPCPPNAHPGGTCVP